MRKLPDRPLMSRKKLTVSYPGEIEPEVRERLARLKMTAQQHFESLLAFDMLLEKAHILTGPHITAGRQDAWHLWQEIIADFGNTKKSLTSYTEHFLERVLQRAVKLHQAESEGGEKKGKPAK